MKKFALKTVLLLCAAAVLSACGMEEFPESILSKHGVSREVRKDFYDRFGQDVKVTDGGHSSFENTDYICFEDRAGRSFETIYLGGVWQITSRILAPEQLSELPEAVLRAFEGLELEAPLAKFDRDGLQEFTRRGFACTYYLFNFDTQLGPDSYGAHGALIDANGNVLLHQKYGLGPTTSEVGFDDALEFIAGRYPGAVVKGHVDNGGTDDFFITDGDVLKQIRFRSRPSLPTEGNWEETVWPVAREDVPAYVWEEFEAEMAERPQDRYEPVNFFYRETRSGNHFGLQGPESSKFLTTFYSERGE